VCADSLVERDEFVGLCAGQTALVTGQVSQSIPLGLMHRNERFYVHHPSFQVSWLSALAD
jgi:hypothetical protein